MVRFVILNEWPSFVALILPDLRVEMSLDQILALGMRVVAFLFTLHKAFCASTRCGI